MIELLLAQIASVIVILMAVIMLIFDGNEEDNGGVNSRGIDGGVFTAPSAAAPSVAAAAPSAAAAAPSVAAAAPSAALAKPPFPVYFGDLKDRAGWKTVKSMPMFKKNGRGRSRSVHIGQFKLFLSEFQFILGQRPAGSGSDFRAIVVYAGSAPGEHMPFLASLFPNVIFILIDPQPHSLVPSRGVDPIAQSLFYVLSKSVEESQIFKSDAEGYMRNFRSRIHVLPESAAAAAEFDRIAEEKRRHPSSSSSSSSSSPSSPPPPPSGNQTPKMSSVFTSDKLANTANEFAAAILSGDDAAKAKTIIGHVRDNLFKYRFHIIEDYFSEGYAAALRDMVIEPNSANYATYYISDIRTSLSSFEAGAENPSDLDIIVNNAMQHMWINILGVQQSLLKFRCPFHNPKDAAGVPIFARKYPFYAAHIERYKKMTGIDLIEDYLNDVYRCAKASRIELQLFAPELSAESRAVIPANAEIVAYDRTEYEEKMAAYNIARAEQFVEQNRPYFDAKIGIDGCINCAAMIRLFEHYMSLDTPGQPYVPAIKALVAECMRAIRRNLADRKHSHGSFFSAERSW